MLSTTRPNWYRPVLGLIAMAIVAIVQWGPSNNGSTELTNTAQATTCTEAERKLGNDCPDDPAAIPSSTSSSSVPPAAPSSTVPTTVTPAPAQPAATTPTTVAPALFSLEEAKVWCTGTSKATCEGRLELLNGGLRVHLKTGTPVEVEFKTAGVCANVYNAQDQTSNAVSPTQKLSVKEMTVERCGAALGSGSATTGSATATATASATTATTAPPVYVVPAQPGGQGVLPYSSTTCDPVAAFGGGTWTPKTGGFLYVGGKGEFTAKTVPTGWMLQGDGVTYRPGDVIDTVVFTARCL